MYYTSTISSFVSCFLTRPVRYETLARPLRRQGFLDERQIEEAFDALQRYPRMRAELEVADAVASKEMGEEGGGGGGVRVGGRRRGGGGVDWLKVGPDREYTLTVRLRRTNAYPPREKEGRAFTPK